MIKINEKKKKFFFSVLIFFCLFIFLFKETYSKSIDTNEIEFNYTFDVDVEGKIIRNITAGTKVSEFLDEIKISDSSNVKLTSSNGTEKANNDIINTGDLLKVYVNNSKKDEYLISVIGDSNGDGRVNSADLVQLRKHIVEYKDGIKTGVYKDAIDINNDQVINSLDLIMIRKVIVNSIEPISIKLSDDKIKLAVGGSYNLGYYISPSNANNKVEWESSDTNVAIVDQNGMVTSVSDGIAIITVTSENGSKKATCNVIVGDLTLNISKTSVTLIDESTTRLVASLSENSIDNQSIIWKSSDEKIATVNENGVVTAKSSGTATITAVSKYDDSIAAKCTVKVRAAKYLFVGNSKTYYPENQNDNKGVPLRFKAIAANAGYEIKFTSAVIGGSSLKEILTTKKSIIKDSYDYVILQENATVTYHDRDNYYNSVNEIKKIVEAENPNVKIFLRKVWGVIKKDVNGNPSVGWTHEIIQTTFDNADYIGENLNVGIINDGPLFYDVIDNTNVKIMKYQGEDTTDVRHQNKTGAYLSALCIYSEIYEKDPTEITYNASISDSNVRILKEYAKKHCYNN